MFCPVTWCRSSAASGSGKTTLLTLCRSPGGIRGRRDPARRRAAGLPHERRAGGSGSLAVSWPGNARALGMVFQSYNLFPHLTALRNVMLGPDQGAASVQKRRRVSIAEDWLDRVGLADAPRPSSVGAVRRPAAAGRYRSGPCHGASPSPPRRGDLGARSRAGAGGAPHNSPPRRGRDNNADRDARDAFLAAGIDARRVHGRRRRSSSRAHPQSCSASRRRSG